MSNAGENLKAIINGINSHDKSCEFPLIEIRMNNYEVERLGWEDIQGVPIVDDMNIPTGRFKLICEKDLVGDTGLRSNIYDQERIDA